MAETQLRFVLAQMRAMPTLEGDDWLARATRANAYLLRNDDVVATLRHVYCDMPCSALVRIAVDALLSYVLNEIAAKADAPGPPSK